MIDGRATSDSLLHLRPGPADAASWDRILAASPGGGHVYQSYAWGEFKGRHHWKPLRVVLYQGDAAVGCAQVLARTFPPLGTLAYCPKGPWLDWENRAHVRVVFEGLEGLLRAQGVFTLRIEPEVRESQDDVKQQLQNLGFRRGRWNMQFKTTMFIDLTPGEDELLARMKAGTRRNVRLAARHGITVHEDNSLDARHTFFDMFERTSRRDGFFMRPRSYIMAGWDALIRSGQGHVFLAKHGSTPLAGMFVCTLGAKYWYKDGASENEGRNLMPTYALQWEVMRWARSQGITTYDMVAIPNPDNLNENDPMWGLYRFKSGFGGTIAEFATAMDVFYRAGAARLWHQSEPLVYRAYMRLFKDVYY